LRIYARAGTARRRMGVAAHAAIEIEARAQAVADILDFAEGLTAAVERVELGAGEPRERAAGVWGALARAGVGLSVKGGSQQKQRRGGGGGSFQVPSPHICIERAVC
jgi:hypothetical protein